MKEQKYSTTLLDRWCESENINDLVEFEEDEAEDPIVKFRERRLKRLEERFGSDPVKKYKQRRKDRLEARGITPDISEEDGGEGSGNWGHEGRPGEIGGSAPGGGNQFRMKTKNGFIGRFSTEFKKPKHYETPSTSFEGEMENLSKNRDDYYRINKAEKMGFTSDVSSGGYNLKFYSKDDYINDYFACKYLDPSKIVRRTKERTAAEELEDTKDLVLEGGAEAIHEATGSSSLRASSLCKTAMIMEDTGLSAQDAVATKAAFKDFTGSSYSIVRSDPHTNTSKLIEQYIERSPKHKGTIYRGIMIGNSSNAEELLEKLRSGKTFCQAGVSSWSSKRSVAKKFSEGYGTRIIFVNKNPKKGVSISHLSTYPDEKEVIESGFAKYKAVNITSTGNNQWEVEVEEL